MRRILHGLNYRDELFFFAIVKSSFPESLGASDGVYGWFAGLPIFFFFFIMYISSIPELPCSAVRFNIGHSLLPCQSPLSPKISN